MARESSRPYLIGYDVADPRRLARVHRHLSRNALALQRSVFALYGTSADLDDAMVALADLTHPREDDVRAYAFNAVHIRVMGRPLLPDGILLFDGGSALEHLSTAGAEW